MAGFDLSQSLLENLCPLHMQSVWRSHRTRRNRVTKRNMKTQAGLDITDKCNLSLMYSYQSYLDWICILHECGSNVGPGESPIVSLLFAEYKTTSKVTSIPGSDQRNNDLLLNSHGLVLFFTCSKGYVRDGGRNQLEPPKRIPLDASSHVGSISLFVFLFPLNCFASSVTNKSTPDQKWFVL